MEERKTSEQGRESEKQPGGTSGPFGFERFESSAVRGFYLIAYGKPGKPEPSFYGGSRTQPAEFKALYFVCEVVLTYLLYSLNSR